MEHEGRALAAGAASSDGLWSALPGLPRYRGVRSGDCAARRPASHCRLGRLPNRSRRGGDRRVGAEAGQPWTATYLFLRDLCQLQMPSRADAGRRAAWSCTVLVVVMTVAVLRRRGGTAASRWHHLIGVDLGVDVDPVAQRLLADQTPDGGWNCWAEMCLSCHRSPDPRRDRRPPRWECANRAVSEELRGKLAGKEAKLLGPASPVVMYGGGGQLVVGIVPRPPAGTVRPAQGDEQLRWRGVLSETAVWPK